MASTDFDEQVSGNDDDHHVENSIAKTPSSPPPSFRSRTSSPTSRHTRRDSDTATGVDQMLADTFDADGIDSDEENDGDDRQRLMRGTPTASPAAEGQTTSNVDTTTDTDSNSRPHTMERRVTALPTFVPTTGRVYGGGSGSDGVFANLNAKPEMTEKLEENPPVCSALFVII